MIRKKVRDWVSKFKFIYNKWYYYKAIEIKYSFKKRERKILIDLVYEKIKKSRTFWLSK